MSPADRRRSIITAALPLLRSQGVQVSTAEIAQAAGVAEGTLFRVFATKDDIIHAVIDDVMDPAHTIDDVLAIDRDAGLAACMVAVIRRLHARIADVSFLMGILHAGGTAHSRPHHARAQHDEHATRLREAIADVLSPYADELRESPERTASLLRSVAFATGHPLLSDNLVADPETVVQLLLHGLLAPQEGRPC